LLGRWLAIQTLAFLVYFFLAFALGYGRAGIHPHLFFIYFPAPLWFFARASLVEGATNQLPRFVGLLAVLALVVPLGLAIKSMTDPATARKAYFNVPYFELAAALRSAGFTAGTVFAWDFPYPLSGNLRPYFPGSRFVSAKFMYYMPPNVSQRGQCIIISASDRADSSDRDIAAAFAQMFGDGRAVLERSPTIVELPMPNSEGRMIHLRYRLFPDGLGTCR
jgi:hypothetical protein